MAQVDPLFIEMCIIMGVWTIVSALVWVFAPRDSDADTIVAICIFWPLIIAFMPVLAVGFLAYKAREWRLARLERKERRIAAKYNRPPYAPPHKGYTTLGRALDDAQDGDEIDIGRD